MYIKAFKMDGLGNDFVIIDQRRQSLNLTKDQIIKICDRKFIGCDQLILIKKNIKIDAGLEFYNSDGSISGACGNGTRCVADLLAKENNKKEITLWTPRGILISKILEDNLVETEIGISKTNWKEIPLSENLNTKNLNITILDKGNKELVGGTAVNVGNPHVVFFVNDIEDYDLKKIGPEIENHKYFPEKCNVTLASIQNKKHVKVKVWERGVGLTKACGTAALATTVAGAELKLTDRCVDIEFLEGSLNINWKNNNDIYMTGQVSDIKKIEVNI